MSMIACPACQEQINRNATKCPFCQSTITTTTKGAGTIGALIVGLMGGGFGGAILGLFLGYWQIWAALGAILCGWLCYKFGLVTKEAE